jgi:glutamate-ammonia-ligase adenylyltransferase
LSTSEATRDSRQSLDLAAAASKIAFRNVESARESLQRVAAHVPVSLASILPGLLADAPDPDTALLLLERLVSEGGGDSMRLLAQHNILAHYALMVFGYSRYLGETLLQNPDLLAGFVPRGALDRSYSREEFEEALARFRGRSEPDEVATLLARFKRREYVRILLRDALNIAPLAETTAEISALSDVLIEAALREATSYLQHRYGTPLHADAGGRIVNTPCAVLSLGKLGGNELNYSSDVDLLFLYGNGQDAPGAEVSNKEYFIRLAQRVTEILSRPNPEGPVFRIDLRLRPQGSEGELAVTLSEALRYYAETAHDWECQALIKVRHSAGDANLARTFIRAMQPRVYTENINFAAIKTALVSREKMRLRRKGSAFRGRNAPIDIKVDPGGIRDIEFLVQCLQRVYGGAEPWLRSGGTLFSLQKLHDKGHITGKEFDELSSAYDFLRHLEHRLQVRLGQRVHRLPSQEADLKILARSMNRLWPGIERFDDLVPVVKRRMAAVAEIYRRVIYQQQSRREHDIRISEFQLCSLPESLHYASEEQILDRIASDSPDLYRILTTKNLDSHTRHNLSRFLSSAFTTSERYAAVLDHPRAMEAALRVFEVSEYFSDILIRSPEAIVTLDPENPAPECSRSTYLFDAAFGMGFAANDPVFKYVSSSPGSYEDKLSLLRKHYRHQVFATGARGLVQPGDVYESLHVNTAVAEAVITAAVEVAGNPDGLSVLALGRLGSCEFDLLSDADLLFVCEDSCDRGRLTRAAEEIVHTCAAYTRDGTIFPIDTRLRPHGAEGELLVSMSQLKEYFSGEVQEWESLMYTKLRFLAGSRSVAEQAKAATQTLFRRQAQSPNFLAATREMRSKLERAEGAGPNLKNSAGGTYDIDFITGYLLIRHGARDTAGNLRQRIWRCVDLFGLDKTMASSLDHAAELFRTTEHVVRLVTGRPHKWLPGTQHSRQVAERLITEMLGREFPDSVEVELEQTLRQVRSIYQKVMV